MEKNNDRWQLNLFSHRIKILENKKLFNRFRDRKDKKLFDYEQDVVDEESSCENYEES